MSWWATDETHNHQRISWVKSASGHPDFPVQNLPFGIFSPAGSSARPGVAIGNEILDLRACADAGLLPQESVEACRQDTLNDLLGLPHTARARLRQRLSDLLSDPAHAPAARSMLYPADACQLHLPARIGDYTDFYVGIHHARNIGRQFRPDNPLLPNYKHVPVGYHGRASSIRPSGVPLRRPLGQRKPPDADGPLFGPCTRLDYEVELGIWIGEGNALGSHIPIAQASGHVAGFCLLNDWSARDIQGWEYQPLGPFLSKNFQTTISPWVVTAEAMAPFRIAHPPRPQDDPPPMAYLWDDADQRHGGFALTLEAFILTDAMRGRGDAPFRLSTGPASSMYWTVHQIVTHHACGGCDLRPGDLLGTGTLSAADRSGFGSLMELSSGGREPISLPDGETRAFLEDGDEIILKASASAPGFTPIGFGECRARVLPAHTD